MKKIVKIVVLLLAFVLIYAAVDRVMSVKSYDGTNVVNKYYALPSDTVDVLFVGSSHIGMNLDSSLLLEEYGISSYALWSSMQTVWNSYYYLKEGLKTQTPKVVVLECFTCAFDNQYSDAPAALKGLNALKPSIDKLKLALCSFPTWQEAVEALWGMPYYHTRYNELTEEDIKSLGYQDTDIQRADARLTTVYPITMLDYNSVAETLSLGQKQETYLRKIIALCNAKKIPLVLLISPYPASEKEAARFNEVEQIAVEENLLCWNYLKSYKEIGIDPDADYVDSAHFNVKGNLKFTRAIGNKLSETFNLPDRRMDRSHIWNVPETKKEMEALYRLSETFVGDGNERYVDTGVKLYENPRSTWTMLTRLDMASFEEGETCLFCYAEEKGDAGFVLKKGSGNSLLLKVAKNYERSLPYTGETVDVVMVKQNTNYTVYVNGQTTIYKEELPGDSYAGTLLIGCQEQISWHGKFDFSSGRVLNLEIFEKPLTDATIAAWSPDALPEPQLPLGLFVEKPEIVYTLSEQFMGDSGRYSQETYLDTNLLLFNEAGSRFTLFARVTPQTIQGDKVFFSCFSEEPDRYRGLLVRQWDDQTLDLIVGANHTTTIPVTAGKPVNLAIVKDGSLYTVYADGEKVVDHVESHIDPYGGTLLIGAQRNAKNDIFRVSRSHVNSLIVMSGVMDEADILAHSYNDAPEPAELVATSVNYRMDQPFAGDGKDNYMDTGVKLYDAPVKNWTLQAIVRTKKGEDAGVYFSCFSEEQPWRGLMLRQDHEESVTLYVGELATHTFELTDKNRTLNLVVVKQGDTYLVYANGELCDELEVRCTRYMGTLLVGCQEDAEGEMFRFSKARVEALELWDGAMDEDEALKRSAQQGAGSRFN